MLYVNSAIREYRLKIGITQAKLSQLSNVSIPFIQNVESGKGNPSFKTMTSLCKALGLEIRLDLEEPNWNLLSTVGAPLTTTQKLIPTRELLLETVRKACQFFSVAENRIGREREWESLQALLLAMKDHYYSSTYQEIEDSPIVSEFVSSLKRTERLIKLRRIALEKISKYL